LRVAVKEPTFEPTTVTVPRSNEIVEAVTVDESRNVRVAVPDSLMSAKQVHRPVVATVQAPPALLADSEVPFMSPITLVSELYKKRVLPLPALLTNSPAASLANAVTDTVSEKSAIRVTVVSRFVKNADEIVAIGPVNFTVLVPITAPVILLNVSVETPTVPSFKITNVSVDEAEPVFVELSTALFE